jgi:hypothetical protein
MAAAASEAVYIPIQDSKEAVRVPLTELDSIEVADLVELLTLEYAPLSLWLQIAVTTNSTPPIHL